MSERIHLTDEAIRMALTPASSAHAPVDLRLSIAAAVDSAAQRRRGWIGDALTPSARVALRLVAVGLVILGLLGVSLLVGSRRAETIPTADTYHGGPERTGVMPGPGPVGDPVQAWSFGAKGPFGPWSPAVADRRVIIGDQGGFVSALDEVTGTALWQVSLGEPINSGVTIAQGIAVVGDDAGKVHGLDVATGAGLWRYLMEGEVRGASAVVDGVVYVSALDGTLAALELETGRLVWPSEVNTGGPIARAIAVADGLIYVGSGGASATDQGRLDAYEATNGELRWSKDLASGNTSSVIVADGRVFVTDGLDTATTANSLRAFDARTGEPAWPSAFQAPTGERLLLSVVADGQVYAPAVDGVLYVLDARDGRLAWSLPIGSSQSPNAGYVDGVLYVTSDDRAIHAIDVATHAERWVHASQGIPTSPAIVDGRIFVGTDLGKVEAVIGEEATATP